MSENKIRRKFLTKLAAFGGAGAAVGLAGCGVGSNTQNNQSTTQSSSNDYPEIRLKFQGGFPAKDPLFDIALDVYGFIEELSEGKIKVEFAFQELENLPADFSCPEGRKKPWGTGHAILSAKDIIQEPFVAINGDDFYGLESFKVVADYYQNGGSEFSMVAFQLDNTLSDFGSVTRGLCTLKGNKLDTVIETGGLIMSEKGMRSDRSIHLNGKEPVSMNVWGFTPDLFGYLESMFIQFLKEEGDALKSEYLIPSVVNNLIQTDKKSVHILHSSAKWFGVTYKEDKSYVMEEIKKLIKDGNYPKNLF